MAKRKLKIKLKSVISLIIASVLLFGAGFGIYKIVSNKYKTISPLTFSMGDIDNAGNYAESKNSVYTKEGFECQGLKIDMDFESNCTYDLHFYDILGQYMGNVCNNIKSITSLPEEYKMAYTCKVVIRPLNAEKLNFLKVPGVAKQLKIKVYKDQNYKQFNSLSISTENKNCMFSYSNDYSGPPIEIIESNDSQGRAIGYAISNPVNLFDGTTVKKVVLVTDYKVNSDSSNEREPLELVLFLAFDNLQINNTQTIITIPEEVKFEDGLYYYDLTKTIENVAKEWPLVRCISFNCSLNKTIPQLYVY